MRTLTVTIRREEGSWWVRSDDMPGYVAVGDSLEEVRGLLAEGVPFYFDDDPEPFEIIEVFDTEESAQA